MICGIIFLNVLSHPPPPHPQKADTSILVLNELHKFSV